MSRFVRIIVIWLMSLMFFQVFPAWSQEQLEESGWTGKLKDGTVITERELKKILKAHQRLLEIDEDISTTVEKGKEETEDNLRNELESTFRPANLAGADLRRADLNGTRLDGINFEGANLAGSNLSGSNLAGANLKEANLIGANLSGANISYSTFARAYYEPADLRGADLRNADLSGSDLMLARMADADLRGADLSEAYVPFADLSNAKLNEAKLNKTNLTVARLHKADLRNAQLDGAVLTGAELFKTDLSRASLKKADLENANLYRTKMLFANLEEANLKGADLKYTDLRFANLDNTDFRGAILIDINLTNTILDNTKFMGDGLPELCLQKATMSHLDSERLNACYVKLVQWEKQATEGGFYNIIKSLYNLILLDLTGQFGLKPGRPLIILLCLIPYFALFYIFSLKTKNQKTGVWLILSKECTPKTTIKEKSFKLTPKFPTKTLPSGIHDKIRFKISCWYRMIRIGLYFSLLSAFNIGWRKLNTKCLITLLQRRDYTLTATGWARSLSVIQSFLSVFLIILWGLITFVHPFYLV